MPTLVPRLNHAYTLAFGTPFLALARMFIKIEPTIHGACAHLPGCCVVQVSSVGPPLDLGTTSGRLDAVCFIIQCYRVLANIASKLPPVELRLPLWHPQQRGKGNVSNPWSCEVMITPQHVVKTISQFDNFCRDAGTSKKLLTSAYAAAAAAAEIQDRTQKKPFLAHAVQGPFFKAGGFSACIAPVGYQRAIETEEVSLGQVLGAHATFGCQNLFLPPCTTLHATVVLLNEWCFVLWFVACAGRTPCGMGMRDVCQGPARGRNRSLGF